MNRSASARFVRIAFMVILVVSNAVVANAGKSEKAADDEDEKFVYLESCTSKIKIDLHKDHPNDIYKIKLFERFPENSSLSCRTNIYASVVEFYNAWMNRSLTPRLSNYKVEDAQRNRMLLCQSLDEQIYHYQFNLFYIRNKEALHKDYFMDLTVSVAYLAPLEADGTEEERRFQSCPSADFLQCKMDGLCIPSRFWCDQFPHCTDSSDERDCIKERDIIVDSSSEEKTINPDEQLWALTTKATRIAASDESKKYNDDVTVSDEVTDLADAVGEIRATDFKTPTTVTTSGNLAARTQQVHSMIVVSSPVTLTGVASGGPFTELSIGDTTLISDSETSSVTAPSQSKITDTATTAVAITWPEAQTDILENGSVYPEMTVLLEKSTPLSLRPTASTKATIQWPLATRPSSVATETDLPKMLTSITSHMTDSYEDYDLELTVTTSSTASTPFSTSPASALDRSGTTTLTGTTTDSSVRNGEFQHTDLAKHNDDGQPHANNKNRNESEVPIRVDRTKNLSVTVVTSKGTKEGKSTTIRPYPPPYPFGPRSGRLDSSNSSSHPSIKSVSLLKTGLALTACAAMLCQQRLM
ncbi:transmembrane protease serine 9-like [Tropilaelaps mercedesae]|uniref:Transmembrane protease serine 9-like n=1 Tax=Tropilaelaps mercedesae TaxID=418985 RepID=A0A1V9XTS2_9ACAR|nr:transmembrane protease serine 9-like [Tropilaelaps mercedesae]